MTTQAQTPSLSSGTVEQGFARQAVDSIERAVELLQQVPTLRQEMITFFDNKRTDPGVVIAACLELATMLVRSPACTDAAREAFSGLLQLEASNIKLALKNVDKQALVAAVEQASVVVDQLSPGASPAHISPELNAFVNQALDEAQKRFENPLLGGITNTAMAITEFTRDNDPEYVGSPASTDPQ